MAYQWVATELRTGALICDLPELVAPSIGVRLCDYYATTATLPVPGAPASWVRATAPMASAIVLLDDDEPVWGAIPVKRIRTDADTVALSLLTAEAYLGRRYVADVTYTQVEQCTLAADLVTRFALDGTIAMQVEATAGTRRRDRTYTHESDKTVLSALSELAGVLGGPEFTVRWTRQVEDDGTSRYLPVLTIADRIGQGYGAIDLPAVFDMPGALTSVELAENWAEGAGANLVIATSSATDQDSARPESPPQTYPDPDRPTIEYRWTPSSSITDIFTLIEHAQAALWLKRDGAQSLSLTARADRRPLLGVDWGIGDDIGYDIGPEAPAFPGGLSGVARCIGWTLDSLDHNPTITPVLADTEALAPVETT